MKERGRREMVKAEAKLEDLDGGVKQKKID